MFGRMYVIYLIAPALPEGVKAINDYDVKPIVLITLYLLSKT